MLAYVVNNVSYEYRRALNCAALANTAAAAALNKRKYVDIMSFILIKELLLTFGNITAS